MREGISLDGARVAKARQALKTTGGRYMRQGEFAEVVGLHPVTLNRIENNKAKVSRETLELLCSHLGCTREYLMGEPEQVDVLELAREQFANAIAKMGAGFSDFTDAVETLHALAADAGQQVPVQ